MSEQNKKIYRRPKDQVAAGDAIPFFYKGVYHLFHLVSPKNTQYYPERVRCSWRHIITKDLVSWEEAPMVLEPSRNPEDPDHNGVWTGSVIFAEGCFHIFYTGYLINSKFPQTICHATSYDGINFKKDPKNPLILPDVEKYESVDWRDPYVFWNDDEQVYWALIAARLNKGPYNFRGCIALAKSKDLIDWDIKKPLYSSFDTFCPECPEIFKMGNIWYLVYSRFSESAGTIYRYSGQYNGPWKIPLNNGLDGRRWYAAKSLYDGKRRLFFGWVHEREGKTDDGTWEWGGDFCIPREAYSEKNGDLAIKCPVEVEKLFKNKLNCKFTSVMGDWNIEKLYIQSNNCNSLSYGFLNNLPKPFRFRCKITPLDIQGKFGLLIKATRDLSKAHVISFEPWPMRVSVIKWPEPLDAFWRDLTDRKVTDSGPDGPHLVERPILFKENKDINCVVQMSDSILEVFVDDRLSLTYRIYEKGDYDLGFFVMSGKVKYSSIEIWKK